MKPFDPKLFPQESGKKSARNAAQQIRECFMPRKTDTDRSNG
jgi:hypothetical protein